VGKKRIFIDRANWRTGGDFAANAVGQHGSGATLLRNTLGYCCCLGFITTQAHPDLNILGISEPDGCRTEIEGLTRYCAGEWQNTQLAGDAMTINDNEYISFAERERRLRELFEDSPYELEFVGEYNERKD